MKGNRLTYRVCLSSVVIVPIIKMKGLKGK